MTTRNDVHNEVEQTRRRERDDQPRLFRPSLACHSEGARGDITNPESLFIQIAGLPNDARRNLCTVVERGVHVESLGRLMEALGITKKEMFVYIDISPATYARRTKGQSKLSTTETNRIYRYARLMSLAINMFHGDSDEARRWLKSPAYAFKNETPLEHAKTEFGAHEVEALIGRIEHGIPA